MHSSRDFTSCTFLPCGTDTPCVTDTSPTYWNPATDGGCGARCSAADATLISAVTTPAEYRPVRDQLTANCMSCMRALTGEVDQTLPVSDVMAAYNRLCGPASTAPANVVQPATAAPNDVRRAN